MTTSSPPSPGAIYLGYETQSDSTGGKPRVYDGPLHCILFGPNGTGKATRVLVPNLLRIEGKSIVVIDPKGQLAAMTALWRHNNNDVKIIDPFGVLQNIVKNTPLEYEKLVECGLVESAGFNPLAYLKPPKLNEDGSVDETDFNSTFFEDASVIAEALIKIPANDQHWAQSAQGLIIALIMWECVEKRSKGEIPSLANVRRMLTEADEFKQREMIGADGKPIIENGEVVYGEFLASGLRKTALEMVQNGGFEISSLAARFAAERSNEELDSIRSTADTQTRWLLSRPMRSDLEKEGGVNFADLKTSKKPMTVYVILPAHYLETHSVWLRLVVSEALRASMTVGGRGVLLMLDEFAALGNLPIVERLFGVTRDYKVQIWPVFQDLPQLKGLYPDRWETLLGMAGVVQSFRAGDLTTAEWISGRSGTFLKVLTNTSIGSGLSGGGMNVSDNTSETTIEWPNIKKGDMFKYEENYSIIYTAGKLEHERLSSPIYEDIAIVKPRSLNNPYYDKPKPAG